MDVKMPVMDGISAAQEIGAAKICPVVMPTAFSQTELVERARDAGVMAKHRQAVHGSRPDAGHRHHQFLVDR